MNEIEKFRREVEGNVERLAHDGAMQRTSAQWLIEATRSRYAYNFTWMGRPIIQLPQDVLAMQEIIWSLRPDLVIETGIAHGGSLILYASMLELIGGNGVVVGVDIDIRAHNRKEIEAHPMFKRIRLVDGSSIDPKTVEQVTSHAGGAKNVLVVLDSNHTHDHVLSELRLYSGFVTVGSYLVVFDTVVEDLPKQLYPDRPWAPGNSPKTAVHAFLRETDRFVIDRAIDAKLQITVAPEGYLKCVK